MMENNQNNEKYWRNEWEKFVNNEFTQIQEDYYINTSYIDRYNLYKKFVNIIVNVLIEIKKYSQNEALEKANLGLDLPQLWCGIMTDFLSNPKYPDFEGTEEERNIFSNEIMQFYQENVTKMFQYL